jgi:hypothetical protein
MTTPIVYLDSSDYSHFGDIERGVSTNQKAISAYPQLLALRDAGKARFVYSMPVLSELLQYDAAHEETCMAKARCVERLCGTRAFVSPERIVAADVAGVAKRLGWTIPDPEGAISEESEWFPRVDGAFQNLRDDFASRVDAQIASYASSRNRAQRRMIEARARKLSLAALAESAAPELAASWGLQVTDVRRSIVAVLENRLTPSEGALRLFRVIALPTALIRAYFVKSSGPKDLPHFLTGPGQLVQARLREMRNQLKAAPDSAMTSKELRALSPWHVAQIGPKLMEISSDEVARLKIPMELTGMLRDRPELLDMMPSCDAFVKMAFAIFVQATDHRSHEPEHSAVGDVFHTLHLPHADLWRTDKRFAPLVRKTLPHYAQRVVGNLADLPGAIAHWHGSSQ